MITPMIRELKKKFPGSFIATLTVPNTANILHNNPYLDEIITDDLKKESFWSVVKELRKNRFTHGLLVFPTERAAWQMFLAGIGTRVGVGHKLYEVITGMRSVDRHNYIPLKHEADFCMDTARKIGLKTDNIDPEIFVTDAEKQQAYEFLEKEGVQKTSFKMMVHTGNLGSAPNWSEDKYLVLIKEILSLGIPEIKILLTAREMTGEFVEKTKSIGGDSVINIAKNIDGLRDFIRVISVTDIFMGNSTGPLHLADALNIKCVGINCHRPMNSVKYWGIINKRSVNIEVPKDYCTKTCSQDQKNCAFENGISVQQVIDGIKTLIN
jgi:heptosyltransferase-2